MGIALEEVILTYDLDQELVEASTDGMLLEVDHRYDSREDFALIAWLPHWMNQRYNFSYLEDPKDAFGELNNLARGLTLDEDQLNDLGRTVSEAGDPLEGARRWAEDNPEV
jgi:glycine betaine/proline transport system substrate-binding protein